MIMIGIIDGLLDKINSIDKPTRNSTNWNDGYDRAIEDVKDVIADYLSSTNELADWALRDEGLDPEKVVNDGLRSLSKKLIDSGHEHAGLMFANQINDRLNNEGDSNV